MRVVEPHHFKANKVAPKKRLKTLFLLASILLLGISGYYLFIYREKVTAPTDVAGINIEDNQTKPDEQITEVVDTVKDTLRTFSDNEFKVFYDNLLQPNLTRVENPPSITGNDIADARIRKIAEDRGYMLRSSPSSELSSIEGNQIQPQVVEPWKKLKSQAAAAGHQISIVSGYRSEQDQRVLFLQRLSAAGASIDAVASGEADSIVDQVLKTSSIPGYSKHHTGYTIDILCAGFAFENFKNSPCNDWITADNYKAAKESGFLPSYPPLADAQGPEPEAWEYVWVGTELLYE